AGAVCARAATPAARAIQIHILLHLLRPEDAVVVATRQKSCCPLAFIPCKAPKLNGNHTPEFTLRIRLLRVPSSGDFEEFHLEHSRAGLCYVVPSRLGSLLILAGYAELVEDPVARAEAADFGQPRFPKRK